MFRELDLVGCYSGIGVGLTGIVSEAAFADSAKAGERSILAAADELIARWLTLI